MIKEQIGREPRGVLGVNTFCEHGYPQVITNRPVSTSAAEVEIFPTLCWLTCPYLRREIALLEATGLIAQFEEEILDDSAFAALVKKNHEDYAQRRLALVPPKVQKRLQEEYPERYAVLAETGVGGIRGLEGVKCLHTHAADYLAFGENIIGAEVLKRLGKPLSCEDGLCHKYNS